jgi:hypothetical protein
LFSFNFLTKGCNFQSPVQLSFSSSNSSRKSNEENSVISNDSSSINNETDEESERNGIDLNVIMNQRNLTDIVRIELEILLYKSQPRQPIAPYHLTSSEDL